MPLSALLISGNTDDVKFFKNVASTLHASFLSQGAGQNFKELLVDHPKTLVFWDINADLLLGPENVKKTVLSLSQCVSPNRLFVISDKPLDEISVMLDLPVFGHFIRRNLNETLADIFRRLGSACFDSKLKSLPTILTQGAVLETVYLKKRADKNTVVDALSQSLKDKNVNGRVAELVAEAADELLMNAIFNAPMDKKGVPYRREIPRGSDFDLNSKEAVKMEFGSFANYFTVCVTDQFGTLQRKTLSASIKMNYKANEYTISKEVHTHAGGLGIYDMYKKGLSFAYVVKPGIETQAWLFIPLASTYKEFKSAFQFFSFLVPDGETT